ncbi:hypothetical protein GCM10022237_12020 [Nocardioides ginsengisoli]|uniref:Uncharacterized protein n=1 Tax=Nocardioides ginsengisoli TaxID=363868 RepID=A0ABW3W6F5_9ACTN
MSDQNPPPPSGPYPPQGQGSFPPQGGQPYGYGQPMPPQKKSHLARNIIIGVVLALILMCGGCFAIVGVGANEVAKEVDKSIKEEQKNDTPTEVKEGQAFKHDGYAIAAGWKVGEEEYGGTTITNMRVTVEEADPDVEGGRSAWLTFRFYKGADVLLEVNCTSNEMQVGETSKMDCSSLETEPIKGWDTIKVADAF